MNNILQNFNEEFLSYVLTLNIEENKVVSFGNLDYDYDLVLIDGEYFLSIYNVALDHYGMPYRIYSATPGYKYKDRIRINNYIFSIESFIFLMNLVF
jgi:hypothetical protein